MYGFNTGAQRSLRSRYNRPRRRFSRWGYRGPRNYGRYYSRRNYRRYSSW